MFSSHEVFTKYEMKHLDDRVVLVDISEGRLLLCVESVLKVIWAASLNPIFVLCASVGVIADVHVRGCKVWGCDAKLPLYRQILCNLFLYKREELRETAGVACQGMHRRAVHFATQTLQCRFS